MKQGWSYYSLGDVCEIYQPTTIATEKLIEDGQYPVFGANGIIGRYDYYNHEEPEVLLTCRGATCGKINVSLPFCWINGNAMVIHKKDGVDLTFDFLRYLMMSIDYEKVITGAAQPQITRQKLSPTIVGFPSVEIQSYIVKELDQINVLIAIKEKQLRELEELEQTIFHEMFGDPVENTKKWQRRQLSSFAIVKGRVGWKGYKKNDLREDGPYVIGATHLSKDGKIDLTNPVYISQEKYEESPEIFINIGDVIIAQRGSIGKVGLVEEEIGEATINPCVLIIRPNDIDGQYLLGYFLHEHMQHRLFMMSTGGVQPMITQKQLNELMVPYPDKELQKEFHQIVNAIKILKRDVAKSKKDLEELLASRMQYWFD